MDTTDKKEKLRTKLKKYFKRKTTQKIDELYYEDTEDYNKLLSVIFSQALLKTLTAPLLRIRYVQQTSYECISTKPKRMKFTDAYNRILNRDNKEPELYRTI